MDLALLVIFKIWKTSTGLVKTDYVDDASNDEFEEHLYVCGDDDGAEYQHNFEEY